MSKYEPLGLYLSRSGKVVVCLTFSEIEGILGFELKPYMRHYEACWYGTAAASPTHMAKGIWCSYGYQVETVNLNMQKVVFKKH